MIARFLREMVFDIVRLQCILRMSSKSKETVISDSLKQV